MKLLRYVLWPLSLVYSGVMGLRNAMFNLGIRRQRRVGAFVISIGNLSTGGTGKTPMAEYLLGLLSQKGISCALLSRGYGRKTRGYLEVLPGKGTAEDFGDEPLQIASRFPGTPVVVCEDRVEGAIRLLKSQPVKVLVLDDAFQHRMIHRDLDIVLMDANHPVHSDLVLPAGNLREARTGLHRADFLVITKISGSRQVNEFKSKYAAFHPGFTTLHPGALVNFSQPRLSVPIESLTGKKIIAFAGIANTAFFERQLSELGAKLTKFLPFADHHAYSEQDLRKIVTGYEREIETGEAWVLTTAKDHARLMGKGWLDKFSPSSFFYIETSVRWLEGEDRLQNLISEKLNEYAGTH